MTCIVGIESKGCVWIGGDSASSDGYTVQISANDKVFRKGSFLFGFTTSWRMGQIIQYCFQPPEHTASVSDMEYLVTQFIPALREKYEAEKWGRAENGRSEGGQFLLGYKDRLYQVQPDYHVHAATCEGDVYDSVGSGFQYALGSLYSTFGKKPQDRIVTALTAAARHNAFVRGPFKTVCLKTAAPGKRKVHK